MEFKRILIAIDNTPSAEKVAINGLQLARQYQAEIALVSIVDGSIMENHDGATPRELEDMAEGSFNTSQQQVIDQVFKNYPVKTFVEQGDPAKVIVMVAENWNADIIVMGTHGRKGIAHLLMGSVAEDVLRHSKKALVIIPIFQS
ncbi:universal stress protein [Mucilaginibacter gilvus]|uniref:Universal stress protein n=1 Tax=Mucilaginibacter gilvus TaxID=2305909 RepID=A0A444MRW3_9SPHI|nr:universal stress protein [Mucilaginibacter gilvus]RWY54333.1 universal stress protein [Mucilaginibacter gilvus]